MVKRFRHWLAVSPLASDRERRQKLLALLIGVCQVISLPALLFALWVRDSDPYAGALLDNARNVLLGGLVIQLLNRRWPTLASGLFLVGLLAQLSSGDPQGEFLFSAGGLFFLTLPILMAAVVLPSWAGFGMATLTSALLLSKAWTLHQDPMLPQALGYYIAAGISWLAAGSLEKALRGLRLLNAELEQRVADRTAALQQANTALTTTNAELHAAHAQLSATYEKLKDLDRLKSRFVSMVSHELRTPLAAIHGFAEMIGAGLYGAPSSGLTGAAERILANTQRLLNLVNDLLDQARMEAGQLALHPEPFAPADVLCNLDDTLRAIVEKKGLTLTLTLDPDLPERLVGDPKRLLQILINLVNNAAKFTESGGITVSLTRHADRWRLAVTDTGPGIAPAAQQFIFEPFRQVDESAVRQHQGFGLGLAIVKQLTELMGGRVRVTSEAGAGTTFTVNLPLVFLPADSPEG